MSQLWEPETLRLLLKRMLLKYQVGTADLIALWDRSGDGELNLSEFTEHIGLYLKPLSAAGEVSSLWETEVIRAVEVHPPYTIPSCACTHRARGRRSP